MSVIGDLQGHADLRSFIQAAATQVSADVPLRLMVAHHFFDLNTSDGASEVLGLLESLASGLPATTTRIPETLTTGQAADILGVSRPTVVKLIDDQKLPAERVGVHRKLLASDVLEYQARVRSGIGAGLDDLAALTDELGLSDT